MSFVSLAARFSVDLDKGVRGSSKKSILPGLLGYAARRFTNCAFWAEAGAVDDLSSTVDLIIAIGEA